MQNKLRIAVTVGLSIITVSFLALTIYRSAWDYNKSGVYFDDEIMTTYNGRFSGGIWDLKVIDKEENFKNKDDGTVVQSKLAKVFKATIYVFDWINDNTKVVYTGKRLLERTHVCKY